MQPHLLGRNVADRHVDRVHHAIAEGDEIGERPVGKRIVLLARQIRAVELQQKARIRDRLVFDPQGAGERVEEGLFARVMLVEYDRRHHAG
jgi:hypothetical protein